jgi:hypothetical protein
VPFIREMVDKSADPDQSIEEWAKSLESELDELIRVEGIDNFQDPDSVDHWDDDPGEEYNDDD